MRTHVSLALIVAAIAAVLVAVPASRASAATPTFDPGYIISDQQFWNYSSMTEADIQAFLDVKGKNCTPNADGTVCLKDYRMDTRTIDASERCPGGYVGAAGESASRIIYKVAQSCRINPQVLLVTLQKEQGLVTATVARTQRTYDRAMGYGCPDSANGACDEGYGGFQNQVINGAAAFRRYAASPGSYSHRAGVENNVRFHPNAACGTSKVYIVNQATAGLYNYTPYQPNAASLAAGYGTGDACSSYGNRNFFNYFNAWFPSDNVFPVGNLDSMTIKYNDVTVSGWALDPETNDSIAVRISVNGRTTAIVANEDRPDVGASTGKGSAHGFTATVAVPFGKSTVCADAVDAQVAGSTSLGCRTFDVKNEVPIVFADVLTMRDGVISTTGWGFDPNSPAPLTLVLAINGVEAARTTTSYPRADVAAAHPAANANTGFAISAPVPPGSNPTACIIWIDNNIAAIGAPRCQSFSTQSPDARVDEVIPVEGGAMVSGWAYDPDSSQPSPVHIYINDLGTPGVTGLVRPDVAQLAPRAHGRAGYSIKAWVPGVGLQRACVFAIDMNGDPNRLIQCRGFTNNAPVGGLDSAVAAPDGIVVTGWAVDRDTKSARTLDVTIGTQVTSITTSLPRADVAAAVPGGGNNDGFSAKVPLPAGVKGPVSVCVSVRDTSSTVKVSLGCASATIP